MVVTSDTSVEIGAAGAATKTYLHGTHRAKPPAATWGAIKPHFARLGITRVAVITGLDVIGIPVVMVCRPNARSLSVAQGKGADLMSAKVSGAMESIEQYCAEQLELPLRYASWNELRRRHLALDPGVVPCLDAREAALRPTLWVEGLRCSDGAPCWLPYGLVHLDLRRPLAPGSDLFPLSSNGLASGNTRDEALVHALLEVIERDAWARFTDLAEEAREQRRIDPASVSSELPRQLLDKLERAGVRVAVWDLSGELGVACFLCQLVERDTEWAFPTGRAEGLGCHTDRTVAFSRALCEAAQSRLCAIAGSRDDMTRASTERIRAPSSIQHAQRELAGGTPGPRRFEQSPLQLFESFDAEREWLTRALERWVGAEVFALDIPSHGVPISVVRVIVTRLRPPHFISSRPPRPSLQLEGAR